MLKKKRNAITTVIALAGVSLATVGFATWVVGLQKDSEDLTVEAIVDSTLNKSVYLEATTNGKKIVLAEESATTKVEGEEKIVYAQANDSTSEIKVDANALKFTFKTLQYSVGSGLTDAETPKQMIIEFLAPDTTKGINASNLVDVDKCKMDTNYRGAATETSGKSTFTYLNFATVNIDLTKASLLKDITDAKATTFKTYEIIKKDYKFTWGSYFENVSPVSFYNTKSAEKVKTLDAAKKKDDLFKDSELASFELQKMADAFKGNKLSIKVSLSTEAME